MMTEGHRRFKSPSCGTEWDRSLYKSYGATEGVRCFKMWVWGMGFETNVTLLQWLDFPTELLSEEAINMFRKGVRKREQVRVPKQKREELPVLKPLWQPWGRGVLWGSGEYPLVSICLICNYQTVGERRSEKEPRSSQNVEMLTCSKARLGPPAPKQGGPWGLCCVVLL